MSQHSNNTKPATPDAAALDDAVAARLARLTARQTPPSSPPSMGGRQSTPGGAATRGAPGKAKRRHAAAGGRKIALALSLATTGGLSYAMSLAPLTTSNTAQPAGVVVAAPATSSTAATGSAAASTTTAEPVAAPAPVVVNGDAFSNRYGPVQVQATFTSDGTITSVTTLQTPYADGESVQINNRAVPTLNAEALAVQSANVDTVSGATYTTNDYIRSLQSAIDSARASGLLASA